MNDINPRNSFWKGETFVFELRTPKARKDYSCDGCGELIPKGKRHAMFTTTNVEGPGFEHWRLHGECYLSNEPMFYGKRPDWRW
jgi:hypothetical protein